MAAKNTGIQQIEETPHGFIVVHAGGTELLRPGSPAHAAMGKVQVLAVYARSRKIAAERVSLAEPSVADGQAPTAQAAHAGSGAATTAGATAQTDKGPQSFLGRLVARFAGQKAPPRGITVVSGPRPGRARIPQPPVIAGSHSGLGRALAGRKSAPAVAEVGPLCLHHWELKAGPKGLYARGVVYGLEHFPDGSIVETPYLGMYSRDTNSFELSNSRETIQLGRVKPGEEATQSVLLQRACAFEKPRPPEYKKPPPDLCLEAIQIKWNRAQFRLSDKSTITSQLNHPLGLAFRILAEDMARQKAKIDWGLPKAMERMRQKLTSLEAAGAALERETVAAGGPPEVLDEARPEDKRQDAPAGDPAAVPGGKPPPVQPVEVPESIYGEIEQMYAPADGGADTHKIAVKTGRGTQIASIAPETFARMEPIVRAGLWKRAILGIDFPDGEAPRFQFKALVDRNDEILSNDAINTLRTNALEQLAKAAAPARPSLAVQPETAAAPPGAIRLPHFPELTPPAEKDSPAPEPGL